MIENATRAWDMAFYAFPLRAGRPDPDRPRRVRRPTGSRCSRSPTGTGARIDVVPDDEHGQIDVAALESMLDERREARLARRTCPTQSGLVNPAAEVGRVGTGRRRAAPARRVPVGRPAAASTSRSSAATCSPPPAASSCAARAAPASSTSAAS